ncbi:hypothetical protein CO154_00985 [Candidatus Pacearchaeota archaeon CG_4_9_14_3_um_filter_31_7]|nr:MAG: hypothetical protein AUJ10_00915 [Candidatus Pacearchaeota archaeon CG1_02_31_27]PIN92373.1 MAG: hypothetical protein COU55_01025 [Candidatus Pacearchaeota archaeon CG10_big_fil_rev_8_21_14_0_10_31_59]PIZ80676.1 MAG: hypothetical protein COX99_02055 [Candidatus Pacearchaeota archaeon CG_4_10_14_0_2_um_filter_31_10]PJA70798.1 MAG: hypothetical protein CO154_00985 [Candidatus Pacearchaeota archaeon CG_4_9_14_3_um_filter_31_7]
MDKEHLLKIKKEKKKRQPIFLRKDYNKKLKLGKKEKKKRRWKFPVGVHNKQRKRMKGHRNIVSIGYKSPKALRHHFNESKIIKIYSVNQLKNLPKEKDFVLLLGGIGMKKRSEILKIAKDRNLIFINVKNIDEELNKIYVEMKSRKEEKDKKKKNKVKKESKEKEKVKKVEEKSTEEKK